MSTTAKEVIVRALHAINADAPGGTGPIIPPIAILWLAARVVAALRANPAALADLNGGEWVPYPSQTVTVLHAPGYDDDGTANIWPTYYVDGERHPAYTLHPVAYFVPRPTPTEGNQA